MLMDSIFGQENFLSEIIWKRSTTHNDAKRWSPISDVIYYYGIASPTWNPPLVPHSVEYIADKYHLQDENGRQYTLDNMTSPKPRPNMMYEWKGFTSPQFGWRYSRETMAKLDSEGRIWYPADKTKRPRLKRYLDEMAGVLMGNVWTDIAPLNSQALERLGYPTQKPQLYAWFLTPEVSFHLNRPDTPQSTLTRQNHPNPLNQNRRINRLVIVIEPQCPRPIHQEAIGHGRQ